MATYLNFCALENLWRHSLGNCWYRLYGKNMGLLQTLWYVQDKLATVQCVNLPNPHQACTKPKVQFSVQLPSHTEPNGRFRFKTSTNLHLILNCLIRNVTTICTWLRNCLKILNKNRHKCLDSMIEDKNKPGYTVEQMYLSSGTSMAQDGHHKLFGLVGYGK